MTWERLILALLPLVERAAVALVNASERKSGQRAHYFPSVRNDDGAWFNSNVCAHCGQVDAQRRPFGSPACR